MTLAFLISVGAISALVALGVWLDGANRRAVLRRHFKRKPKP